jgi:hypothetical protein
MCVRWIAAILAAVLLSGCGQSAFLGFTGSSSYIDALPHTQRTELTDRFESRALLSATYLNATHPDEPDYRAHESFFVGLYIDDDFKGEKAGIHNPLFHLTLNDHNYTRATEVDENDPLLKLMPLVNRWSRYYIVQFPRHGAARLTLKLTDRDTNRSVALTFPAVDR